MPIPQPGTGSASDLPPQVRAAFNVLAYCRQLTDPYLTAAPNDGPVSQARKLTQLERGVEVAALNLLRDWLNGELDLPGPDPDLGLGGMELGALGLELGPEEEGPSSGQASTGIE